MLYSYSAKCGVVVPVKQKEKNSLEVVDLLLKRKLIKKNILADFKGVQFENIKEEFIEIIKNNVELGILLNYGYAVEECDALKLPTTIEKALKTIENKIEDYSEIFKIYCFSECIEEDLEFINLDVVEIGNIKIISDEFKYHMLNANACIYELGDNSVFEEKFVDEKFIKLVNIPGASIYLECEGSYN